MLLPSRELWPPDYPLAIRYRAFRLKMMREDPNKLVQAKHYYRDNPADFVEHWCDTYDPRKVSSGSSAKIPFVLFKRQREFVEFLHGLIQGESSGLVEKSRDMGATWLCCAFSVWLWLFVPGASVGWGSRKQELVDSIGDPDSIFEKMRMLVHSLPQDFWPRDFDPKSDMVHMRIVNPETDATITGEIGDNIGRGGRKLVYFKDESAHYEHPEMIEAALTDNTRIQVDISSVNGLGTVFHRKREAGVDWAPGQPIVKGKTNVFVFDWRDHPEKDQAWYDQRRTKASEEGLLHIFAQEVDRNYAASLEGVVIPAEWVASAIDAHSILDFDDSGAWMAGLDVADEGGDTSALALRKGVVLRSCEEWGNRDTGFTTRKALDACRGLAPPDTVFYLDLNYDCIGVGAGVKGEANRLAEEGLVPRGVRLVPWNAGGEVLNKEQRFIRHDKMSPLNGELFANMKAQAWWNLRRRFELTYRAVKSKRDDASLEEKAFTWDAGDLISLPSTLPNLRKIQKELSQATASMGSRLKMVIDKTPEGAKSPNLADAIVMAFWALAPRMVMTPGALQRAAMPPRMGRPRGARLRL